MADAKGKPPAKKDKKFSKSTLYEIKGEGMQRKTRACPKCGPGVFMAAHATRMACGNCGYTEFKGKA